LLLHLAFQAVPPHARPIFKKSFEAAAPAQTPRRAAQSEHFALLRQLERSKTTIKRKKGQPHDCPFPL
jgi:hypothetical protein